MNTNQVLAPRPFKKKNSKAEKAEAPFKFFDVLKAIAVYLAACFAFMALLVGPIILDGLKLNRRE